MINWIQDKLWRRRIENNRLGVMRIKMMAACLEQGKESLGHADFCCCQECKDIRDYIDLSRSQKRRARKANMKDLCVDAY